MKFEVSLFKNKFDNVPADRVWSWKEFTDQCRTPLIRKEKDGQLFCPAKFKGRRAKVNVTQISLFVLDIDHNADIDLISKELVLLNCRYLIYSTHSHLRKTKSNPRAEPRYRVVIPLNEPISSERFPVLWHYIKQTTKLPIDESAKDASRMFYLPAIATSDALFEFYEYEGSELNWTNLQLPTDRPTSALVQSKGGATLGLQSERNSELFKRAKKLYETGLTRAGVKTALLDINATCCEPPLDTDEVEDIVRNAEKYPINIQAERSIQIKPLPFVRLSDVETRDVDWLWERLIPRGFFTLCDGVEGIGKTFLMLKVAATVVNGGVLPGSAAKVERGEVLLLSAEDSASFVLKPRLEGMGVACDSIWTLNGPFTLDDQGFLYLSQMLTENNIKFVLIDALFSFTGKVNLNQDNEVRTITDRLNRLAEEHNCAIVGVRHIGKSKGYGDPRNAGLNGVGWRAGARSHLLIGHHPDDKAKRAIAQTKTNLTAEFNKSYGFTIDETGVFTWTGESDLTVDTMLSFKQNESIQERSTRNVAKDFLRRQLASGRVGAQDIFDAADNAGISKATLKRAKSELGIISAKDSKFHGGWYWELPKAQRDLPHKGIIEGFQTNGSDPLRENETRKCSYDHNLVEDDQIFVNDNVRETLGVANGRPYMKCGCGKHKYEGQPCLFCGPSVAE